MSCTVLLTFQYSPCLAATGIDGIGRLVGKCSSVASLPCKYLLDASLLGNLSQELPG